MGRYTPTHTPEQQEAIAAAMLGDHGPRMTARQACEAAEQGRLGLDPFVVKPKTAYVIRDRIEAAKAPANSSPSQTLEERARTLLELKMSRLEGQKGQVDAIELRATIQAMMALNRGTPSKPSKPEPEQEQPEPPSWLDQFHEAEQTEAPLTPQGEGLTNHGAYTEADSSNASNEQREDDDAIPVRWEAGALHPLAGVDRGL